MDNASYIEALFRSMLGRPPDAGALAHFTAVLDRLGDLRPVMNAIMRSPEYKARQPAPYVPAFDLRGRLGRTLTIVDVGARKLSYEDHVYAPLVRNCGLSCRCIGFEPLGDRRGELMEGEIPITALPHFIGDGSRQTFHINNNDATSSLLPLNDALNARFGGLRELRTEALSSVQTSRLDDVLSDIDHVDLLKLDIQGAELMALAGAERVLRRTNVVHCEVEFGPIYQGQPLFADIEAFLRGRGFTLIDLISQTRYSYAADATSFSPGERLLWADAIFFREAQPISEDDAIAQAAIAMHVYERNGLARHVLSEAGVDIASATLASEA